MSTAGAQRELARYQLPGGTQRAVIAQRVQGHVALSDVPVTNDGRVYLIERHVHSSAELDGLVHAYVEHSHTAGSPAAIAHRPVVDELVDTLT